MEMFVSTTSTNITPRTQLVLEGQRGCIGNTVIHLFNAIDEPTLVETLTWGYDCHDDGRNNHRFNIPVDLFFE